VNGEGRFADTVNGRTNSSDRGVLLITCSDIGIDPYTLVARKHSRIYEVQNAGNLVRPDDLHVQGTLSLYDVQVIVLCGHSACGVIHHLSQSAPSAVSPTSPAASAPN
jgi:carbonic anhydrase